MLPTELQLLFPLPTDDVFIESALAFEVVVPEIESVDAAWAGLADALPVGEGAEDEDEGAPFGRASVPPAALCSGGRAEPRTTPSVAEERGLTALLDVSA